MFVIKCGKFINWKLKPKFSSISNGLKMYVQSNSKPLCTWKPPIFVPKRHFLQFFRKPKVTQLKIIDDVPDHYQLIFRNSAERYIFYTQLCSTVTTVLVVGTIIFTYGAPTQEVKFTSAFDPDHKPTADPNDMHLYLAIFMGIIITLHIFISKMPLRIYYLWQQQKYIFVLPASLPNQTKKMVCKIGEVKKLPPEGISLMKDSKYLIGDDKTVIMSEDSFNKPADLYIMLGIQRDPNTED